MLGDRAEAAAARGKGSWEFLEREVLEAGLTANQIVHSARRGRAESQSARSRRPAWLGAYSFRAVTSEGFMRVALGLTAATAVTLM